MSSAPKTPTVFLSYSWANSEAAERIYIDLSQIGIKVTKDNHRLEYKDDLQKFMQGIRNADFAILLISEDYLRSVNCMYEACQLLKEQEVQKKILPVIVDGTSIYKSENRIDLIRYWQEVISALQAKLAGIEPTLAIDTYRDLKAMNEILQLIDGFIKLMTSMLLTTLSELQAAYYLPLLKAMGFEDITYMTDLLVVFEADSPDEKGVLLDKYVSKYGPNTFYHVFKANNLNLQSKFEQAKFNFQEAIRLKPDNYEAFNNLGYLYDMRYKDYDNAKKCYEQAIRINPELTIARINMGLLKSHHLDDKEGAKRQYEKILSYDPTCVKAYNNLANLYRDVNRTAKDFIIAEKLLLKAIEIDPEYVEALMNYANLLKLHGRIDEGNEYYRQALAHNKNPELRTVIETLMRSKKG